MAAPARSDTRRSRPLRPTHAAEYDAERTKFYLRAACGILIKRRDVATDPTCQECRRLMAESADFRF